MTLAKNKRDQYLLIVLVVIIIAVGFIWWKGSLSEEPPYSEEKTFKKIEIDFEFLKSVSLDNFEPFTGAPEFEGKISLRDPFLPQ